MTTTIEIEARVLGRRSSNLESQQLQLDGLAATPTLRELIDTVVRAEVAAFEQRSDDRRFVRFLTEREIAEGQEAGKVAAGPISEDVTTDVDVEAAVETALLAHDDGLFQVLVNGTTVDSLDDTVELGATPQVMFLRLVALAGG